jgi:hypothetical protein
MTRNVESTQNEKLKFRRQNDGSYLVAGRFVVTPKAEVAGETVAGEIPSAKWHLHDLKLKRGRDVGGLNEARDAIVEVLKSESK